MVSVTCISMLGVDMLQCFIHNFSLLFTNYIKVDSQAHSQGCMMHSQVRQNVNKFCHKFYQKIGICIVSKAKKVDLLGPYS